jgi:uncharacterized protein (DUF342 family)
MRELNADGYFQVRYSNDKIQAFVDIFPPKGGGRNVTAAEIITALENRGVAYGIHLEALENATRHVAAAATAVQGLIAAQGHAPVAGTDAHILWHIDAELASRPFPRRPDGLPDYLRFDPARLVKTGQELATMTPGLPGSPGKTLFAPFDAVPQAPGREAPLLTGQGVRTDANRTRYLAEQTGFIELHNERLSIRALTLVEGDLVGGNHTFPGGLIVLGNLQAATVIARGPVAVSGTIEVSSVRAFGEAFIAAASRSLIVSDADIHLSGAVTDCEVMTPLRICASEKSAVVKGLLTAATGIEVFDIGSYQRDTTQVVLGSTAYSAMRMRELDTDIHAAEKNAERIGAALKPLTSKTAEPITPAKRMLVRALLDQKREIEQHIGRLHAEKRARQMAHYGDNGSLRVLGTMYPGLRIDVYGARFDVEQRESHVEFHRDAGGKHVACLRIKARAA